MRNVELLMVLFLSLFFSCSENVDVPVNNSESSEQDSPKVNLTLSRTSIEKLSDYGINEISIYAYLSDELICEETFSFDEGSFEVPLPLGENIRTFVVAGAGEISGTDKLSTACVSQKSSNMQKLVYISDVIGFTSDNSIKSLAVELKQIMGQAVFEPIEPLEELQLVSDFDELKVTFTNVGTRYYVESGKTETEDVEVETFANSGFGAFVYSFPTVKNGTLTSVDVVYYKDGSEVNRTRSALDTGIIFETSKRSIVKMELLNPDWVDIPWGSETEYGTTLMNSRAGKTEPRFEIEESFYEF